MLGIEDTKEAGNRHNGQGHPQKHIQKDMHSLQQASPSMTQSLFLGYSRRPLSPDYLFNLPQHTVLLSAAPILSWISRSIVRMELSLLRGDSQPVQSFATFFVSISPTAVLDVVASKAAIPAAMRGGLAQQDWGARRPGNSDLFLDLSGRGLDLRLVKTGAEGAGPV